MTPREQFLCALAGEMPDRLSVTIWNNKLLGGAFDQQLLDLGVCIINKSSVYRRSLPGIKTEIRDRTAADGHTIRETTFRTPDGNLTTVEHILPHTVWIEKYLFSDSRDYAALAALIAARTYEHDLKKFIDDDTMYGGHSIARPTVIHSPMHDLMYEFMGIENFSIEWAENRHLVLHLCEVLTGDWRRRVQLTASSPARYATIDGNTEFTIVGEERFLKYYFPCIEEACEIMHAAGKFAGAHLDGHNRRIAPLIAKTSLDYIESFTPPPDCDLSVAEAREIWKDKSLLVHFPSSLHLYDTATMRDHVEEILKQAAPGDRFSIGTSEDVPNRGVTTLLPLYRILNDLSKLPLSKVTQKCEITKGDITI
ncbi:hypothetical protein JXO59_05140 [candidate division KSB1 bacterium]|nr:hypothetical protein [candidate division KSB1 bacterium]